MDGRTTFVKAGARCGGPRGGEGWVSKPQDTEIQAGDTKIQARRNEIQVPAQQNPNAFSFRQSRFLNGLNVDSDRLEDNCGSTGQATSPSGPFARALSEKLNHRRDDLVRKCRFEIFPKNRPLPKQATNAFDRSGAGQCRALSEEPKTILLQTVVIAALGLLARPPALADSFSSCAATGTPRSARVGASFVRGGSSRRLLTFSKSFDYRLSAAPK